MITFTWEFTESGYIYWSAEWDGRLDNDPLIDADDSKNIADWGSPLAHTLDYRQEWDYREYLKGLTEQERNTGKFLGSTSIGKPGNPEDHDPMKVMKAGDIVSPNPVTLVLCQLLESPQAIQANSGNVHAYAYRSKLLGALSLLWD